MAATRACVSEGTVGQIVEVLAPPFRAQQGQVVKIILKVPVPSRTEAQIVILPVFPNLVGAVMPILKQIVQVTHFIPQEFVCCTDRGYSFFPAAASR